MKNFVKLFLTVGLTLCSLTANAQFTLDKYRIVLADGERRTDLRLYNSGSEFASYRVQLVDMQMDENGNVTQVESYEHSAKPLVRVSPRLTKNVTPNNYQKIRIRARGSSETGEYRTHLLVEELLPPYQGDVEGMVIRPNFRVIIPIFVLRGELDFNVKADDFQFDSKTQELTFTLHRSGNSSALVNLSLEDVQGEVVYQQNGLAVYQEIDKRFVKIKLPDTVNNLKNLILKLTPLDEETAMFRHSF